MILLNGLCFLNELIFVFFYRNCYQTVEIVSVLTFECIKKGQFVNTMVGFLRLIRSKTSTMSNAIQCKIITLL